MFTDVTQKQDGILLLEDGRFFSGFLIGSKNLTCGEVCFSTAMIGYQHTITDPSFANQIIVFTFPHIGNVGINNIDFERNNVFASGIVIRDISDGFHPLSNMCINDWLKKNSISGISGVDTRALTSHIRIYGHKRGKIIPVDDISTFDSSNYSFDNVGEEYFVNSFSDSDFFDIYKKDGSRKIVVVDFGLKGGIVSSLSKIDCSCEVIHGIEGFAEKAIKLRPDGIVLSNGPGDPFLISKYASYEINELIESSMNIFGICMGHQLLSHAIGSKTIKMKNGHRGVNHPVINLDTGIVEITSQNHGYVVDESTVPNFAKVTHKSLFDGSVEGLEISGKNIFSVQYHPEGAPGTNDSKYLFDKFIEKI